MALKKLNGKILALGLTLAVSGGMVACGTNDTETASEYIKLDKGKYITLSEKDYKGITGKTHDTKTTTKTINERIKQNLDSQTKTKDVKKGTIKNGDAVKIDYVGTIDGKEFEGGSAQDQILNIGSNQFIKGFESGLVGAKVGETKTLNLKFPKNYSQKDLAGKPVKFKVTVKSIQKQVKPKLDAKFVKTQKDDKGKAFKSVKDYKKFIKKQLIKENKENDENMTKSELWAKVTKKAKMKTDKNKKEIYPENLVKQLKENTKKQYEDYAKQNGSNLKDFIKEQMQMSEKDFDKQLDAFAKEQVKGNLIVYTIVNNENLTMGSDEYQKFIDDSLKKMNMTEKQFKQQSQGKSYEEAMGGKDAIVNQIYKDKAMDFVYDNAKLTTKDNKKEAKPNKARKNTK